VRKSLDNIMYQIAATLDIFKEQLDLTDVLEMELPLLADLYEARAKFVEDKRKIEAREIEKAKRDQASSVVKK
jgi:hypothetical protein